MPQTCASALVAEIAAQGIDTVFGIPGVHTLDFYRALAASPLRHVTPRHEQAAGFMADGFARASGRPAACMLITGPGLLNAATAIGQAYSDSVPMLVLATVTGRDDLGLGRGRLHEMPDQLAALRGLLQDRALRLNSPAQAVAALRMLMAGMALGRPRPAYIEIPLDVAAAALDAAPQPAAAPPHLFRPGPDHAAIARAAAAIGRARRPVVILGGGAVAAAAAARALVARIGAVAVTTIAGKGILPETDPATLGASLNEPATRALIDEADLVIAIGTELASPDHFLDLLPIRPPLIRIDLDPAVLARDHPAMLGILADAGLALAALDAALPEGPRPCWHQGCAAMRQAQHERLRRERPEHALVLDALARALPEDAILATDMTQIAYSGNGYYPSARPATWLHPAGFGTLGYALPAAIGASLAQPGRRVVALAGDYGIGFTLAELATARDLALPLPVVVWNNGGLGQIAQDMDRRQIPRLGVEIAPPDFARLAQGYGAAYRRPPTLAELAGALAEAAAQAGPTLIEITPEAARA